MGWIGVDLDGTIAAHYWPQKGPYDETRIGDPIPLMLERVKQWLADGIDVRIFTARVGPHGGKDAEANIERARVAIEDWCIRHLGRPLPVTATKDYNMMELWDDRAVQILSNTGLRADGRK